MLKETIVAVTVVTMSAGAAVLPTAVSAGERPIVVASCGACNPCNPCAACNPCNPCAACNPCNPCGGCNPCSG